MILPIPEMLSGHGISPTPQRMAIFESIRSRRDHPTVDMLYDDLHEELPTLSRTTVYSTMRLLAANGLVLEIRTEDGELRYDGTTDFHAHFKCRHCGGLFDLEAPVPHRHFVAMPTGFRVDEEELTYFGLCPECSGNSGKQEE